jgi:hypothetical protein
MKASVLGLWVATVAVGGGALYFWNQLQGERERSAGLAAQVVDFKARIAQIEAAQAKGDVKFDHRGPAGAGTSGGQAVGGSGNLPPPPADAVVQEAGEARATPWKAGALPERSAAMHKMMRAQIRANNKRLYADVGTTLGLSKDETNKLIDLLTDQQASAFEPFRGGAEAAEFEDAWTARQRRLQDEIASLLGGERVTSLHEYQKTLPSRQELEMFTRQLQGYDAPLDEDQRKGLLKVMVEERERIPAPDYFDGTDIEKFQKTRVAWEEDYQERVASQARGILDTTQLDAYTEYQQAQKDMRAQFGALMPAGPGRAVRAVGGGNVGFATAVPVGGATIPAEAVFISAPSASDRKE